ncbi:hypothetical protein M427DRAFT_70926 [Gonapodya prolifera JEL478]|uniref:MFS general substrate transporter n=1 Tax=Gonapodya prolifera (strain JEL478) TaxID=1344416 RepID=A0A139AC33_GONPJ|nr:hypothetical protein M427DRAFT_70926 [Gonapodya prolifera JEL478]|eukprot:KXS14035.1 hypothetical protein M427DRAFT_70926 [Gonapodya prolifera JEL478]
MGSDAHAETKRKAATTVAQRWPWLIVLTSCISQALLHSLISSWGVFQSHLFTQGKFAQTSSGILAMVGGTMGAGYCLVGPLVGWMADRFGFFPVSFCGAILLSAGFALGSFATELWQLFLTLGIVYGVGGAGLYYPASAAVAHAFPLGHKSRATAIGLAITGINLGPFILAPLSAFLLAHYGWSTTLRALSLSYGVIGILCSLSFRGIGGTSTTSRALAVNPHHRRLSDGKVFPLPGPSAVAVAEENFVSPPLEKTNPLATIPESLSRPMTPSGPTSPSHESSGPTPDVDSTKSTKYSKRQSLPASFSSHNGEHTHRPTGSDSDMSRPPSFPPPAHRGSLVGMKPADQGSHSKSSGSSGSGLGTSLPKKLSRKSKSGSGSHGTLKESRSADRVPQKDGLGADEQLPHGHRKIFSADDTQDAARRQSNPSSFRDLARFSQTQGAGNMTAVRAPSISSLSKAPTISKSSIVLGAAGHDRIPSTVVLRSAIDFGGSMSLGSSQNITSSTRLRLGSQVVFGSQLITTSTPEPKHGTGGTSTGGGGKHGSKPPPKLPMSDLIRTSLFWSMGAMMFSVNMGLYTPPYFVPIQATASLGISSSDAATLVSILNVAAVAGRVGQGVVGKAVGTVNGMLLSTVAMGVFVVGVWPVCRSFVTMAVFVAGFGFWSGTYKGLMMLTIANFFSPYGLASATGLLFPSLVPGYLAGNVVAGILLDMGSTTTTTTLADGTVQVGRTLGNALPAMAFAGGCVLVGSCVVAFIRWRKVRDLCRVIEEPQNWEKGKIPEEEEVSKPPPPEKVLVGAATHSTSRSSSQSTTPSTPNGPSANGPPSGPSPSDSPSLSTGVIAGIAAGGGVIVVGLIIVGIVVAKRGKVKGAQPDYHSVTQTFPKSEQAAYSSQSLGNLSTFSATPASSSVGSALPWYPLHIPPSPNTIKVVHLEFHLSLPQYVASAQDELSLFPGQPVELLNIYRDVLVIESVVTKSGDGNH